MRLSMMKGQVMTCWESQQSTTHRGHDRDYPDGAERGYDMSTLGERQTFDVNEVGPRPRQSFALQKRILKARDSPEHGMTYCLVHADPQNAG